MVTFSGIINDPLKNSQFWNEWAPIDVICGGRTKSPLILRQKKKILLLIYGNDFGRVNSPSNPEHLEKANGSIELTVSGMVRSPLKPVQS